MARRLGYGERLARHFAVALVLLFGTFVAPAHAAAMAPLHAASMEQAHGAPCPVSGMHGARGGEDQPMTAEERVVMNGGMICCPGHALDASVAMAQPARLAMGLVTQARRDALIGLTDPDVEIEPPRR